MANTHFTPIVADADASPPTWNNPMSQLSDAIDGHTHNPAITGDGGVVDHNSLANRGANPHSAIDAHLGSQQNPHQTNLAQAAQAGGTVPVDQVAADTVEAATNDTLTSASTLRNNLNRIRYQLAALAGTVGGAVVRSLANHTHNPTIAGDGGTIVQAGIEFDSAERASHATSATPSLGDNLAHIRADIKDMQNGLGFAQGSITSYHIADKGLSGNDLADGSVGPDQLAKGAVGLNQLGPLLATAASDATTKSLVLTILPGVFWPDGVTAVAVTQQTVVYSAAELPSLADQARIDTISLNLAGSPVKTTGTPDPNPVAPAVPAGNLPVCQVYFHGVATGTNVGIYQTVGTAGYNSSTDAYIYKDIRPFLNFGGGDTSVVDERPTVNPNGATTVFNTGGTFVKGSTHVSVASSLTAAPVVYTRVAASPGTNQYCEGTSSGAAPYNQITFGVAPATGSEIRISYTTNSAASGNGTKIDYLAVVDTAPTSPTPNGSVVTFILPDTFILGTTQLTVAASLTAAPTRLTRVASAPSTNQYCEGDATGAAPYNQVTLGVAPATGSVIRATYYKGGTAPVVNLIWDETPTGTINGTNRNFTTAYAFQSGSLEVYGGSSATATLTKYVKGTHYTENANLLGFTFTTGNAPATGSVLVVQYARGDVATNNADTVDGFSAAATAAPGILLALDGSGKLPASVTGDAATVGGFAPSQAPAAGQVPVVAGDGSLTLPGQLLLGNNTPLLFAKASGDTGSKPGLKSDPTTNNTRLVLLSGTGGVVVRNNADSADLLALSNAGILTLTAALTFPNNQALTFTKAATGNNSKWLHDTSEYLKAVAGATGFKVRNNADTADNLTLTDAGNLTVRGTLAALATTVTSLAATGLTLTGSGTVSGNLTVSGTLSAQAASAGGAGLMSAAHYSLLAGATSAGTSSTIVMRDGSGHIYAGGNFNQAANEGRTDQPYMLFGRISTDSFLRTFNPAYLTAGAANALSSGTTDGDKLHNLSTAYTTTNGWAKSVLPSGRAIYSYIVSAAAAAAQDQVVASLTTPDSLLMVSNVVIAATVYGANANQVNASVRGSGNTHNATSSIDIVVSTVDGTNLNTKDSTIYVQLIAFQR